MHLTPWTDGITEALQEVESTCFQQVFGPIAIGGVQRLKLLCRINRSRRPTENSRSQIVEACEQKGEGNILHAC